MNVTLRSLKLPILHLDLDAFFAAVEILERPELVHVPVIIGGTGPRAVVASANYPARKFGVRSAMPVAEALRLAPQAVVIPPTMEKYRYYSKQVFSILDRFTPTIEPISVDEAFMDVSGSYRLYPDTETLVRELRATILKETGLVASVGGAAVKFVAKIASDRAKPDGVLLIPKEDTLFFLGPLPVGALWGVGRKTQEILYNLGVRNIADLRDTPLSVLQQRLGQSLAEHVLQLSHGQDPRAVEPESVTKSISQEHTFPVDESSLDELNTLLWEMSLAVARRARAAELSGKSVSIKVRIQNFQTFTRSITLPESTDVGKVIFAHAQELLQEFWNTKDAIAVRLLGVRLSHFHDDTLAGLPLWEEDEPWEQVETTLDSLAEKFGPGIAKPASTLRTGDRISADRATSFDGKL